ncbi:MAG TPA: polysaccharide biosynthesis/export family protein [Pyrinomonadaceae bacterium]|nr:polysaccharide biosynthesis/export family protein [Pyrinomonadaceae bacterium]
MNIQRSSGLAIMVCLLACAAHAQQGKSSTPKVQPSSPAAKPSQAAQPYLLGPGDVLEIKIFGQPDLNSNPQVDGDGNLSSLPFLDPIPAKCRTEREVQKDVIAAYTRLIKDPQISVRVLERNSRQPASVFGAVRQGGKVTLQKKVRLNELIAASGGFTEKAAGTIQILHTEPVLCPDAGDEVEALPLNPAAIPFQVVKIADLQKGLANPVIRSGDLVLVTEAEPVYITGSVVSSGGILLRDGLTLSRALGMVGGTRKEAKLSEIRIYRQRPGSYEQEIIKVDYAAIKKNQKPDVFLQPYDVIDVSENGIFSGRGWLDLLVGGLSGGLRNTLARPIP